MDSVGGRLVDISGSSVGAVSGESQQKTVSASSTGYLSEGQNLWGSKANQTRFDTMFRVYEDEQPGFYVVIGAKTSEVQASLGWLQFHGSVLRHAVRNQWRLNKYNQEYTQLLLGALTREEFLSIARQYAKPFENMPPERLALAAAVILETIDEELDSGDLAQILNADPVAIEKSLSMYPELTKSSLSGDLDERADSSAEND